MKMIRAMARYIRLHPVLWAVGLITPAFAALATNLAFAQGMQRYTEELLRPDALFGRVVAIMLTTLAILVLTTLIEDITRYLFAIFIVRTENHVRQDMFSHIVRAKYQELAKLDRGEVLTRYNADVGAATNLITWDIFSLLWPLVLGTGYLATLFAADLWIGMAMLSITVCIILLNVFFARRFATTEKAVLASRDGVAQALDSAIRGKMSVRLLSAGNSVAQKVASEAQRMYRSENARVSLTAARAMSLECLATVCSSLMAPLACIFAARGNIPIASVVLIAQLSRYLVLYTNGFGIAWMNFGVHAVSYERLQAVFGIAMEDDAGREAVIPEQQDGDVVLACRDVCIAYDGHAVISKVNFSIRQGEIVALLGPSGSGKSSMVKALLGLVEYSGDILLYGQNVRTLPLQRLRQCISYVPEHSELFDGTVGENLRYAAAESSDESILLSLRDAALDEEDIALRDTGEAGGKLSGGQRQRVAIARALLKDAPLYILDEPTASLDAESESRVLTTLQGLKQQGKGLLLITHRESTLRIADRILCIQEGCVVEQCSMDCVHSQ